MRQRLRHVHVTCDPKDNLVRTVSALICVKRASVDAPTTTTTATTTLTATDLNLIRPLLPRNNEAFYLLALVAAAVAVTVAVVVVAAVVAAQIQLCC